MSGDVYRLFISSRDGDDKIIAAIDEIKSTYGEHSPTYREDSYGFTVYSQRTAQEKERAVSDAIKRQKADQISELWQRLSEKSMQHYEMRLEFVRNIRLGTSAYTDVLLQDYLSRLITNSCTTTRYILNVLKTKGDENTKKAIKQYRSRPEDLLFVLAYSEMRDSANGFYAYCWEQGSYTITPKTNQPLRDIYEFLERYGYEMSDDEIDMREGRHEIYREYLKLMEVRNAE